MGSNLGQSAPESDLQRIGRLHRIELLDGALDQFAEVVQGIHPDDHVANGRAIHEHQHTLAHANTQGA